MNEIYPLTIVRDRYTGVYSGGKYTAWNLNPQFIPHAIVEDDVTCRIFWIENIIPVGVGETINEAIECLRKQLESRIDGRWN